MERKENRDRKTVYKKMSGKNFLLSVFAQDDNLCVFTHYTISSFVYVEKRSG